MIISLKVILRWGLFLLLSQFLSPIAVGAEAGSGGMDGASLWGRVRLVPREGVTPGVSGDGAYGDRRLRDAAFVDYEHPGFMVVYLDTGASPRGVATLRIERTRWSARLSPLNSAVGVGGSIRLLNNDAETHVLSCPAVGILVVLGPGRSRVLLADTAGLLDIYLLDAGPDPAKVFVAPGPFCVATDGKWRLIGLPIGAARLHAWHPRFPESVSDVDIISGANTPLNIEISVKNLGAENDTGETFP